MSIERQAISALKWATASKIAVQVTSWTVTLIVVRLLTPEDYGLMAKVAVVCAISGAVSELGLEAAIVRATDVARDDLRKIFGIALLLGAAATLIVIAMAPLLAKLFNEPRLAWPMAVAAMQIIIGAVATVPSALLTRRLAFDRLSKIELAAGVTSALATLGLAAMGAGVWALVFGSLFGVALRTVLLLSGSIPEAPRFSTRGIGEQLKFGLTVATNRASYIVIVQSDVLIGSLFLSTTEIGQYAVALQLATLPMAKVMGTINQILLPAVARQQTDLASVRRSLLKAISLLSIFSFPSLWGISAVAPELVTVLFGHKWLDAVPALLILPLIVPLRMIFSVMFTTSLALGNRQLDLRNTIANSVLLPTGFLVGAQWGLLGLSAAWLVSVPLAYLVSVPAVMRAVGVRASEVAAECWAPAAAATFMYAAVAGLRSVVERQPASLSLAVLVATGAAVYFTVLVVLSRRQLLSALRFIRALASRDAA